MPLCQNRVIGLVVVLLACAWVQVPFARAADETAAGNGGGGATAAATPGLPTPRQLEASGAIIGTITINPRDVFDLDQPEDNHWLFRLADRIHRTSRPGAIRAQLLFQSGERYSRRLVEESARNIRNNLGFVREPRIRAVAYHDNIVDLEVTTQDVWTLLPGINFSRLGGADYSGVDFADANLLGLGKYLEAGRTSNIDRTSTYVQWADPNVLGSHWTDSTFLAHNSDGSVWSFSAGLPFYALQTPWSVGLDAGASTYTNTRYRLGNAWDAYHVAAAAGDLAYGWRIRADDWWTERISVGWRVDRSDFAAAARQPLIGALPLDRNLSYPFAHVQWIENSYITTRDLDLIARTEDVHHGLLADLTIGWATRTFGSDRNDAVVDAAISWGSQLRQADQLEISARVHARHDFGGTSDELVSGSASYYLKTSDSTRLLLRAIQDRGYRLDLDHLLQLGGDDGLRGYPLRYQDGSQRTLLTIEERLYTHWYLARLLNVGAAAFFDAGRNTGSDPYGTPQYGWLKDIGVGLRLGNSRSSFGNVIHIDLAAPLNRYTDISRLQLLVSTARTY